MGLPFLVKIETQQHVLGQSVMLERWFAVVGVAKDVKSDGGEDSNGVIYRPKWTRENRNNARGWIKRGWGSRVAE